MGLRARDGAVACSLRGWNDAARTALAAHCSATFSVAVAAESIEAAEEEATASYYP